MPWFFSWKDKNTGEWQEPEERDTKEQARKAGRARNPRAHAYVKRDDDDNVGRSKKSFWDLLRGK